MGSKRDLVVFCGREFISASRNVSAILQAAYPLAVETRIVDQALVRDTLASRQFDRVVAVPLMTRLSADILSNSPALKLVHQWGVGLEGVDIETASELGIPVANTPSTQLTARATAEQAIHLLLKASRWSDGHPNLKSKNENWGGPRGHNLYAKRIAVVGYRGAVGGRICSILKNGFGADVVGIGRSSKTLAEALREIPPVDALILSAPLTEQTKSMVNNDVFQQLKPGASVVNVGRGALIDRSALTQALEADVDMKFATDVWWSEPPDFLSDTLLGHPRVIISPHIGGLTHDASQLIDERCAEGITEFLFGNKLPKFCVNTHAIKDRIPASVTIQKPTEPTKSTSLRLQVHPPELERPSAFLTRMVLSELRGVLPVDEVTTNATELLRRGTDESLHDPVAPDICVMPRCTESVSKALAICSKYSYPVVPFGRGTSLEGGVSALAGGLSIDLSNMNRVINVNDQDFDCLVEAGVSRLQLNQELRSTGLFFPVDPGADATIGGMCSTRASGTTAVRYGTMRDRVMGLTVVLPSGEVIKTGGRALKSSAGYDLTGLFVGSEGTLGVITEARLKLAPVPESICSAVAEFKDVDSAVNTVIQLKQLGVPVARAEFLDEITMRAVRAAGLSSPSDHHQEKDHPSLFLEFHGTEAAVIEQSQLTRSLAENLISYRESILEEERSQLWRARHNAFYSVMKLRPTGTRGLPTDVCVPVSRLAECISETFKDIQREGIIAPIFGHIGDGNFHCILLHNAEIDGEEGLVKLQQFNDRLVSRALKMEGTCTGEHGIGYGKKNWLEIEHGPIAIEVMRNLKRSVDPQGIMNPGKVV